MPSELPGVTGSLPRHSFALFRNGNNDDKRPKAKEGEMRSENERCSRHLVGSYTSYADAERAVDSLSDDGFRVEGLSIVARDLGLVENVTGRMDYGRAAIQNAVAGGLVGAVFGFLFGLLSWIDPLISGFALALYGFLLGALIGLAFGLISHAMSGGRRSFSSQGSISAASYELLADDLDEARRAARMLESRDLQGV